MVSDFIYLLWAPLLTNMGKPACKLVVCGAVTVGKTSMLEQILYGNHTIGKVSFSCIHHSMRNRTSSQSFKNLKVCVYYICVLKLVIVPILMRTANSVCVCFKLVIVLHL